MTTRETEISDSLIDKTQTALTDNDQNKLTLDTDSSRKLMDEIIKATPAWPDVGSLIEGQVIAKGKLSVFVDLPPFGTGIIFGREYLNARDIIKKVNIGDSVTAKVIDPEGDDGYIELSLREAKQAIVWHEAEQLLKDKLMIELTIKDANKGGLIVEWQGLDGFIPASQLKPEHYPRVPDGDKDKIITELQELIGKKISVAIIGLDAKEGKLIFSEKMTDNKERKAIIDKYSLGDVVEGEVTGAVDFGVFVKVEEGLEGLVHISELDWALVENPRDMYKVGDSIKAKIIEIKDDKISLSIKALKENPWLAAEKKYQKGDKVDGVVIKYNKHGALVSIEEGVAGLVHISEFSSEDDLHRQLELGKSYPFTINLFEPKEQRMTLIYQTETKTSTKPLADQTTAEKTTEEISKEK
ncbi:MAG: S1 RNA-binding domain-containing protein [Candidatus Paceibacterota bacterium]